MQTMLRQFLAAVAITIGAVAAPSAAQANQCIWNKGAFILAVEWYKPWDLTLHIDTSKANQPPQYKFGRRVGYPVDRREMLLTGQGTCSNEDEQRTAVVTVSNPLFPLQPRLSNALLTHIHVANGVEQEKGVLNSATVAAHLVANGPHDVWTSAGKPSLVVTPPRDRYVDVWGTVFQVFDGFGGPVPPANYLYPK
jgi:hypothetical protein